MNPVYIKSRWVFVLLLVSLRSFAADYAASAALLLLEGERGGTKAILDHAEYRRLVGAVQSDSKAVRALGAILERHNITTRKDGRLIGYEPFDSLCQNLDSENFDLVHASLDAFRSAGTRVPGMYLYQIKKRVRDPSFFWRRNSHLVNSARRVLASVTVLQRLGIRFAHVSECVWHAMFPFSRR